LPVQPNTENQRLAAALAALDPPRKHYQQYLSARQANDDLWHPPQGLHAFLRAFFHVKSADWPGKQAASVEGANRRRTCTNAYLLRHGSRQDDARNRRSIPTFRRRGRGLQMAHEAELGVYAEEYGRTGFQGALQAYRVYSDPDLNAELRLFSGKTIDVPSLFIGGKSDWGTYAAPGALDLMKTKAATRMGGIELIEGAGHWIQQEQPVRLSMLLLAFIKDVGVTDHTSR
jgi:pimeloyl-ACP methyl ester carboxylesterase